MRSWIQSLCFNRRVLQVSLCLVACSWGAPQAWAHGGGLMEAQWLGIVLLIKAAMDTAHSVWSTVLSAGVERTLSDQATSSETLAPFVNSRSANSLQGLEHILSQAPRQSVRTDPRARAQEFLFNPASSGSSSSSSSSSIQPSSSSLSSSSSSSLSSSSSARSNHGLSASQLEGHGITLEQADEIESLLYTDNEGVFFIPTAYDEDVRIDIIKLCLAVQNDIQERKLKWNPDNIPQLIKRLMETQGLNAHIRIESLKISNLHQKNKKNQQASLLNNFLNALRSGAIKESIMQLIDDILKSQQTRLDREYALGQVLEQEEDINGEPFNHD